MCRRAIEPRTGLWTIPAGFMEIGESTEQAAIRETMEEANAEVEAVALYAVFSLPRISQVHVLFRGAMRIEAFKPGIESLDVRLFSPSDILLGRAGVSRRPRGVGSVCAGTGTGYLLRARGRCAAPHEILNNRSHRPCQLPWGMINPSLDCGWTNANPLPLS
ncbi:MAG: NUDIX domain-containing protein [Nitrospiraceae bacterium]